MRIASRSREAMLHMNTTYSPGEPGQWTVVGIPLGVGAGEGARPLPPTTQIRDTVEQSRGASPVANPGEVFVEQLAEMLH